MNFTVTIAVKNAPYKPKNTPGFPADRMEEMQAAFESFKAEILRRKDAGKTEKPDRLNSRTGS